MTKEQADQVEELEALDIKCNALNEVLFHATDTRSEDYIASQEQYFHMCNYLKILNKRIASWHK